MGRVTKCATSLLILGIGLGVGLTGCPSPREQPSPSDQAVECNLVLVPRPGQVSTYQLVTERRRQVVARGPADGQVSEVSSGTTGSRVEMTYTESVQRVDPNGNALLDIRIQELVIKAEQVGDSVLDFHSARPEDANSPLARLVGRGYRVERAPGGQVVRILDAADARAAVAADPGTAQGRAAASLLSDRSIRDRHSVAALSGGGAGPHRTGQSWNQVRTVSFDILGSKSFEKVYTFKGVEQDQGRPVAVLDLEGVLAAGGAAQAGQADPGTPVWIDQFDTSFTYTGQCRLDLGAGQVDAATEVLEVQWVGLDPRAAVDATQGEPSSIRMKATEGFWLRRVGQTTPEPPSTRPVSGAPPGEDEPRPVLRFEQGTPLEYRFVSQRDVQILWDPKPAASIDPNRASQMTESLDLVMVYQPVRVDPNGRAFLEAICKSVTARRTQLTGEPDSRADAVEGLRGRTFSLVVEPSGRISDARSLDALLKEIGRLPFRDDPRQGRIKDPEMISDVVATQWFLWDPIARLEAGRAAVGRTWTSQVSLPTPMVMRKARDVRYTLKGIRQTPAGRVAVIDSTYTLSEQAPPASWPIPYSGRFRVSGPFGMLGAYTILDLQGAGQDRFHLDRGVWDGSEQQFQIVMQASLPIPLRRGSGAHPQVVIRQTIRAERVG